MKKFNSIFAEFAQRAAETQMNSVDKASSNAVYESLKELSGGLSLPTSAFNSEMKQILKASTIETVSLIKSISAEYLSGVQQAVVRSIASGRGLADLVPFLEKKKSITVRRARMIAHDQTRKAYNNLNRARMEKVGLKKFRWLHTGGSAHPRQLHIDYNGKIFSFDNPPIIVKETGERGFPGQAINCRCRMQAVIDFSDE
jgi:SPP1 gp7 family putative phage head morphogenesis protein